MSNALRILGGKVYDPTNGIDGQVRDILIHDGRIVSALPPNVSAKTIHANGLVVMPGGVDVHCHIASASINRARALQGEEHASHVHFANPKHNLRGGTGVLTPSTFVTGYRYAALGYTAAIEAAVAPSGARQTHLELHDTPNIDAGFLLLVANHAKVIDLIDRGDEAGVTAFIGELIRRTGAYGIKVVNPGGVASWRHDAKHHTIESLDDAVAGTTVTPRRILQAMATAAEQLKLPHPPHIHCNRLGVPGNVETTLETLRTLDGRRAHLTHLQFHAYGRTKKGNFTSAAHQLCDYLNDHPNITADVGQVVFGDALTLSADTPLEYTLWQLTGQKYVSIETELETGCGMLPIRYSDKQYLHSLQWAIGLELMLACNDPWRMLLSTDHPNGGSFLSYPTIIAALMSKAVRDEQMNKAHPRALKHSRLKDLTREMTLSDIAIITRAGPARVLGLKNKGHLAPGADADITLYHDNPGDPRMMFESPRYVIKAGQVIIEDAELRTPVRCERLSTPIEASDRGAHALKEWFDTKGSYSVNQLGITR